MFHPLPLYVGLRYVRARSHKFFVSFITWASLLGVCVGVAALIVILSVMNGLESELRDRLLALGAQVRITATSAAPAATGPSRAEWQNVARLAARAAGVTDVAPYVELQALAVRQPEMLPVLLRGIDPQAQASIEELSPALVQGKLADLTPGSDRVIVGSVIAEQLGLMRGDSLTVLIPTLNPDGTPAPKLREVTVAGIFEIGLQEGGDGTLILADIEDVRALGAEGTASEGVRARLADVLTAPAVAARLRGLVPKPFEVTDWTQDNASYFRAISIEKTMMSLILLMIVAVAAFNIVAMLVMVVTDKRTDIAIVRTFGAAPARVMGIFVTQGLVIGWLGVLLGVIIGVAIALHVDAIVPFLEHTFHFQIMDADVYYITTIPSEVHWSNVAVIAVAALLLTGLATLYPALRAARTPPAEALRYE
ncbi:MAG TPA: lipoprotein-releasing ABC transporter permease subunit [Steroidobacteraceae bacterium]|jgi:lipoprotein-releasing system permease protein|nr:lipoprotein-releasing ABC transporter permease subunit [Steroidobacteraceae bacterium]